VVCVHLLEVKAVKLAGACSESKLEAEAPMMLASISQSMKDATRNGSLAFTLRHNVRIAILLDLYDLC
jgi:hypothetical protein